jgi:hypothetical protein
MVYLNTKEKKEFFEGILPQAEVEYAASYPPISTCRNTSNSRGLLQMVEHCRRHWEHLPLRMAAPLSHFVLCD